MYKQKQFTQKNKLIAILIGGVMLLAVVLGITLSGSHTSAYAAVAQTGYWQETSGSGYWDSAMTAPLMGRYGSFIDFDDIFFYDNLPYGYNLHSPSTPYNGKKAKFYGVSLRTKIGDVWYVQDYYDVDEAISGIGYNIYSFNMSKYFTMIPGQVHEAYAFAVCSNKDCKDYAVGQLFRSTIISFTPEVLIDGQSELAPSASITYHNVDSVPAHWTQSYTRLNGVTLPTAPNKDSYAFAGWHDNANLTGNAVTTIPSGSGGNKNFYAKYEFMEEAVPLPPDPTKNGYTFGGWFFDSSLTAPYDFTPIYADTDLYAKFDPITYSIGYTLNDGELSGQATEFTIESGDITLAIPTRTGYHFKGWYTNANLTGEAVATIPTGSTENRTYYAKWELIRYTVTFYVDGAVYRSMEVDYGTTLGSLAANPLLAQYSIQSVAYLDGQTPTYSAKGFIVEGDAVMHLEEKTGVDSTVGWAQAHWQLLAGIIGGSIGLLAVASVITFFIRRRKNSWR